jgi:hypothetical protein
MLIAYEFSLLESRENIVKLVRDRIPVSWDHLNDHSIDILLNKFLDEMVEIYQNQALSVSKLNCQQECVHQMLCEFMNYDNPHLDDSIWDAWITDIIDCLNAQMEFKLKSKTELK